MRVSQQEKALTHERIVASAARLLRERGVDGTSVNDVMTDAKLTHGGFYRHFADKDALLSAALEQSFADIFGLVDSALESGGEPAQVIAEFQEFYLSDEHAAMPGTGCPVAAVGADVARTSPDLKQRFGNGVNQMIDRLAGGTKGAAGDKKARAMRQFAMMAGAIMIARASDPDTAKAILLACRADVRRIPR